MMGTSYTELQKNLRYFLGISGTLITLGCIAIYSASSLFALEKHHIQTYFLQKHVLGLVFGCFVSCIWALCPLRLIKKYSPLLFVTSIGVTMITFIPGYGIQIHGSSRWVSTGFLLLQPSELLKLTGILYAAHLFSKDTRSRNMITPFIQLIFIIVTISSILLLQPDFGLMVTLGVTLCIIYIVQFGLSRQIVYTLLATIPILSCLIYFKAYRIRRVLIFLNPWQDPQGSGFQIIQSLIAIGSGRWLGVGIGHSQQHFSYLPMQHTDFIFSIIAQEVGFFGSALLIMLFIMFAYYGIKIAYNIPRQFSSLLVFGYIIIMSLQAVIHIAVATGLAPTKGIGLPFISAGNSALIIHLSMIGLIINSVYDQ